MTALYEIKDKDKRREEIDRRLKAVISGATNTNLLDKLKSFTIKNNGAK